MNTEYHPVYNWPNLVSLIRILMAPVLIVLANMQLANAYLLALIFTVFTDVLDGFLARRLNQITEMGSHLDSWGDFIIYSTMAYCAWLLWPEIVTREMIYILVLIASFTLPVLVGLIKFKTLTSYHTWSVKLAVAVTIVGYLLLFSGLSSWPFKVAVVLSVIAAIEEIAISLVMHHSHVDVRSLWQAIKYNKSDQAQQNMSSQ